MGLFDILPSKGESLGDKGAPIQGGTEGREPSVTVNRINEISWNAWNNPKGVVLVFDDVPIAGTSHNNADGVSRQKILARMQQWEAIDVVPEPANPHDANALSIVGGMGQIGYVPQTQAAAICRLIDCGWVPLAKLSALYGGNGKSYGAKATIQLAQPASAIAHVMKVKNITGAERKEAAQEVGEGDILLLEPSLDNEVDIFVAQPLGEVGQLALADAKKVRHLLSQGMDVIAVATRITENNNLNVTGIELTVLASRARTISQSDGD